MCYKISILPRNAKEMLMRKKCRRRVVVWDLFRPLPQQPAWSNLPVEVRHKATRLMARLLLEAQATQRHDRHGAAVGKGVGDE
jgi:hypothetical protein